MADVHRSLHFVAREHPDLDSRLPEIVDGLSDVLLELVFDRGRAIQLKLEFKLLTDGIDGRFFVGLSCCLEVFGGPLVVSMLRDFFARNEQRAQACLGEVVYELLCLEEVFRAGKQALFNDGVGAFADDKDFAFGGPHDHGHSLPRGVELNHVEKAIAAFTSPLGLANHVTRVISALEAKTQMPRSIDEGQFIRR